MKWKLTWRGREFTQDQVTVEHLLAVVELMGGDTWDLLPSRGPQALLAHLTAFLAIADDQPWPKVMAELRAAPGAEFAGAVSMYDDPEG